MRFTPDVMLQEMQFSFGRAIERIPLTLTWGLNPQDHGSLNAVYEHTDAVLAPGTNFTSLEAQEWLDDLCQNLTDWSQKPGSPIVAGTVVCPTPLIKEIAQQRSLPFPMPAEVSPPSTSLRLTCALVCRRALHMLTLDQRRILRSSCERTRR